jgi:hypothetical protein
MTNWLKIEDNIFDCLKNEHQLSIDHKWVTSYFTIDTNNKNYFDIILDLYTNKKIFNWEDKKSKGFESSIKSMDIYNGILSFTIRSKKLDIKDKSHERNERLEQILPNKNEI